jgi:hypothetical protein
LPGFLGATLLWFAAGTHARGAGQIDAGGHRATSASYTVDSSIGGVGGIASYTATRLEVKAGFIGQLFEVTNLAVVAQPAAINETNSTQLSAVATLDDGTVTLLQGGEVAWHEPAFPLTSISSTGRAHATNVYQNTAATIVGAWSGGQGTGTVSVVDLNPDDFGLYAGDTIADAWQVHYFGKNNSNGLPNVVAGAPGQNNLFNYVAGMDPTNPASAFQFSIEPVVGQTSQKRLIFSPRFTDRTYTILSRSNAASGSWQKLSSFAVVDDRDERRVTDLAATPPSRFYRVQISKP